MDFPFLFFRERTSRKDVKKAKNTKNFCRGERLFALFNFTTETQSHREYIIVGIAHCAVRQKITTKIQNTEMYRIP